MLGSMDYWLNFSNFNHDLVGLYPPSDISHYHFAGQKCSLSVFKVIDDSHMSSKFFMFKADTVMW